MRNRTRGTVVALLAIASTALLGSGISGADPVADTTPPTVSIKQEMSKGPGGDAGYQSVSFGLKDAGKIKSTVINGSTFPLTPNVYSDRNFVTPGQFGAVQGVNTMDVYDVTGNKTTVSFKLDTIAPSVTSIQQVYQTKENGRIAVTLNFSEPVTGLGQGWYGSGSVWTKVYYSSKSYTVSFSDAVGNVGSYSFTVDKTAPVVAERTQVYNTKGGGRTDVTLVFSEPVLGLGQGWNGSGNVWTKAYYANPKAGIVVDFVDTVGNPGSYTFDYTPSPAPAAPSTGSSAFGSSGF